MLMAPCLYYIQLPEVTNQIVQFPNAVDSPNRSIIKQSKFTTLGTKINPMNASTSVDGQDH